MKRPGIGPAFIPANAGQYPVVRGHHSQLMDHPRECGASVNGGIVIPPYQWIISAIAELSPSIA